MHVKKEVLCFVSYVLVKIFGVFSRLFPYVRIGSGFSTGSQVDQSIAGTPVFTSQESFSVV